MRRLLGRKLLLTRSADDAAEWASALEAEGATPVLLPCLHIEPFTDPSLQARLATAVSEADWLIFTSKRGVDAVAELIGTKLPPALRIATVGAMTAAAARAHFGRADRVGRGTGAELGAELAADRPLRAGGRCVLALAENAGPALQDALGAAGAHVTRFDVYRTVPARPVEPRRPLSELDCDTVILASPSAVTGFANQVNVDKTGLFVTIGPTTSAAVRAQRWQVIAEAREPSLAGIINSVLETTHV
jgi:uroporphyrinogen-III synthase